MAYFQQQTIRDWATHFYVGQVENHEAIVEAMAPYVTDDKYFTEPWIYSKCKSTCQHPKNNELPWDVFYDAVKPNIKSYFDTLQPLGEYQVRSGEVWLNLYEKGGYQEIHDHAFPNRSFSCAYMLNLPSENNAGGELVFENTNFPIIQSSGLNRIFNAFNYEKFIPEVTNGTLVVFPSWIKHYVLPNKSYTPRVTISANFTVEGNYK